MQIDGENIEIMFMNMMLEKKLLKRHKSKNTSLDAYLFRNGLKKFKFEIVQVMEHKVILPKPTPIFIRILSLVYNMDIMFSCG
jgi:hypothetical protein